MPEYKKKFLQSSSVSTERRKEDVRRCVRLFMIFHLLSPGEKNIPVQVGYTRDISTRGVYFFTTRGPAVGEDIALTVYVPASPEQKLPPRLEAKGKVVRVEEAEEQEFHSKLSGVAVKYLEKVTVFV